MRRSLLTTARPLRNTREHSNVTAERCRPQGKTKAGPLAPCSVFLPRESLVNASEANVLEAHGAQPRAIQQVLGVEDEGLLPRGLDAVEVERAEFRPPGAHD